ncbi:hypothetical protein [Streptomyces sp. 900105755]
MAEHREHAPWYAAKTNPSLSDLVAKLRRVIIAARFMPTRPGRPTEQEIRAVRQAWATAGTDAAA